MPKLELAQKKQLERWIGSGPQSFSLLYSFSRDGASAPTFHQLCDNKGPTVTVLYNTEGSIYGGYSECSWNSVGNYLANSKSFLFRLAFSRKAKYDKFPNKTGTHGIYCNSNYGPTFGAGHDLYTFAGTLTLQGDRYTLNGGTNFGNSYGMKGLTSAQNETGTHGIYSNSNYGPTFGAGHDLYTFAGTLTLQGDRYTLNGGTNFGNSYDMKGLTSAQITNDVKTIYDLEVYSVTESTLEKQWRNTSEWNSEFLHDLKEEIEHYAPPKQLKLKATNILVLGPVGAGKSSFFNTISSVFRGYVTGQASSGSAEQSITSKYRMYSVRQNVLAKPLRFRLCDTRGLEESQGIDSMEISYILDGHVPDGYNFNPSTSINSDIHGFKRTPTLDDKIHCVCFVIDSSTVNVLSEKMLERIKAIKSRIHQKGIPQIALATKIDKVCSHVEEDLSSVFKSDAVCEVVENVSQILGFPRGHVLPMKNYEREIETSNDVSILALISLRQMLRATEDYMFNCLDELQDLSMGSEDGQLSQ